MDIKGAKGSCQMCSREHDQLKLFSYSSHLNAFFRGVDNFMPQEGTRQVKPFSANITHKLSVLGVIRYFQVDRQSDRLV